MYRCPPVFYPLSRAISPSKPPVYPLFTPSIRIQGVYWGFTRGLQGVYWGMGRWVGFGVWRCRQPVPGKRPGKTAGGASRPGVRPARLRASAAKCAAPCLSPLFPPRRHAQGSAPAVSPRSARRPGRRASRRRRRRRHPVSCGPGPASRQNAILRYSRLQICATRKVPETVGCARGVVPMQRGHGLWGDAQL